MSTELARCFAKSDNVSNPWARLQNDDLATFQNFTLKKQNSKFQFDIIPVKFEIKICRCVGIQLKVKFKNNFQNSMKIISSWKVRSTTL